jgi:hypothetical protein
MPSRTTDCCFLFVEAHPREIFAIRASLRRGRGRELWKPSLFRYPCWATLLSRETSVSDFPHSRQTRLARGVIRPQNGQILCDRTSWTCGLNVANNVARNCHADARRRRDGRYRSINFTFAGILRCLREPRPLTMTGTRHAILCRIAHIALILQSILIARSMCAVSELSNSDQLFVHVALMMVLRRALPLSFRSSELSQHI